MKKLIVSVILVMAIGLTACGSESTQTSSSGWEQVDSAESIEAATEDVTVDPLNLSGQWVSQVNNGSSMAAYIGDGGISVFWILDGDDTPWTYWVGTYDAPETDEDSYSWTSTNTYTGNGLMASSDDTKDFSYRDGTLTYNVSFQGDTYSVDMTRGEWDMTNVPSDLIGAAAATTVSDVTIEIKDSGWVTRNGYLYAWFDLYNPSEDTAVDLTTVRVTARDASNALLGTNDQVVSIIYPQQDYVYGFQMFSVEEEPSTVEFSVLENEDYNLEKAAGLDPYVPMEAINVAVRDGKIVGEISNSNDYTIDMVAVVCLCKDASGNLIGIASTFVDDVAASTTTPFEVSTYIDGISSVEAYATFWM